MSRPQNLRLSDEFVLRLVLSNPIPDRLIRNLGLVPDDVGSVVRDEFGLRGPTLTPRLLYTLLLVAQGFSDQRIADEVGVSLEGIKTRLKRLLSHYRARNRTELVAKAIRSGDIYAVPRSGV